MRFGADAGPLAGEHLLDPNEPTLIGRSSAAEKAGLRIPPEADPERKTSGTHASLMLDEGGHWIIEDLGSKNGTIVDGQRLPSNGVARLGERARLQFGDEGPQAEFILRTDEESTHETLPRAGYRIILAPAETLFGGAGKLHDFGQAVVRIGGAPGSDLVLPPEAYPTVSPHHARIEWTGVGFRLLDRSRRGTFVNSAKIDAVMLEEGNIIELGDGGPKLAVQTIETPQAGARSKAVSELEDAIRLLEQQGARNEVQSAAASERLRRRNFLFGGLGLAALGVGGYGLWRALKKTPDQKLALLAKRHEHALLMVYCHFRVLATVKGEEIEHDTGDSAGTGFFIDYAGHVITNRHVLQPWRGQDEYAASLASAYAVHGKDKVRVESRLAAWPAYTRFRRDRGVDYSVGFNDHSRRNLKILGMPRTKLAVQTFEEEDDEGNPIEVEVERIPHDDSDLALLQLRDAEVPIDSVAPLLSDGERPGVLDQIWAGGFPKGPQILEADKAVPTHTRGEVKKVEKGYQLDLTAVGGSSGSPVLDVDGRVIGVITRAEGRHVELIPAAAIRALAIDHGLDLPS